MKSLFHHDHRGAGAKDSLEQRLLDPQARWISIYIRDRNSEMSCTITCAMLPLKSF